VVQLMIAALLLACSGGESERGETSPTPGRAAARGGLTTYEEGRLWHPRPGTAWQWQLTGALDTSVDVPVYDVDGFATDASTVARLHELGRHVICYLDVGGWEEYRSDAAAYPTSVLGKRIDGWPAERWVDIRQLALVGPILESRIAMCAGKGFDAVEADQIELTGNDTGFPISEDDQLRFARWMAAAVHAHGMSVALKNDVEQAQELEPTFDLAINEECVRYDECLPLQKFLRNGKAVLHVEYDLEPSAFCPRTRALGFSSMRKDRQLSAWRQPC